MKKLYTIIAVLLLVSILSTAVIVLLSPDVIPAHYGAAGAVDRLGSKYENLIFPGISIAVTGLYLLLIRYQRKKNAAEIEQKVLLFVAIITIVLFLALGLFFGIAGIRYDGSSEPVNKDLVVGFTGIGMGILLILLGNIMPKTRRNALFGLRTKWSMENDRIWQKSQRFGGFAAVACGLLVILETVFLPGAALLPVICGTALVWLAVCIAASYAYWKKDPKCPNGEGADAEAVLP